MTTIITEQGLRVGRSTPVRARAGALGGFLLVVTPKGWNILVLS